MTKKSEIIFGVQSLKEAIQTGQELERIFFKKDLKGEQARELVQLARRASIPCQFVPTEKLNRFTRKNHQGVVGLISPILYFDIEQLVVRLFEQGRAPMLMMLDGVTDVRNFGALARSAECAGIDGLIIPHKGSARIHEDAVKTSAGALLTMPVARVAQLKDAATYLKQSGLRIVAATEKAPLNIYEADFRDPLVFVMGSEERGISTEVLALCDEQVSIPLYGKISSLNVSVAASLLMYEAVRQRRIQQS